MIEGTVSVDISAPADRVFDLVSDITRMGSWSPETVSAAWIAPATGPAVGARFTGTNKAKSTSWTTECEVTACTPGREFSFTVQTKDGLGSSWGYRLEPRDAGVRLHEYFSSPREQTFFRRRMNELVLGIGNRTDHNLEGMRVTLERIKAAAETS